jgi:lycopene cyclase domain-containing protein
MIRWEYLLSGIVACGLVVLFDRLLGTKIVRTRRFWRYLGVMLLCQLLFETYATSRPVFIYNSCCIIGLRIINTPVEDTLFGLALYGLVVVLWQWSGRNFGYTETAPS